MKYADYISEIEIDSLWKGRKHIRWMLDPKVNILSGGNGIGKSTILTRIMNGAKNLSNQLPGLRIETVPEDAQSVRFDIISTPDSRSDYNINLEKLQEKYSKYNDEKQKEIFANILDDIFSSTEKHVIRGKKYVELEQWDEQLDLQKLSNGEKQMLCLLLTVLLENNQSTVLFLDEPEASLHMEWQQKLINII